MHNAGTQEAVSRPASVQVNANFCHFTVLVHAALVVERAADRTAKGLRTIKPRSELLSEADDTTGGRKHSNSSVRRPASVIA